MVDFLNGHYAAVPTFDGKPTAPDERHTQQRLAIVFDYRHAPTLSKPGRRARVCFESTLYTVSQHDLHLSQFRQTELTNAFGR